MGYILLWVEILAVSLLLAATLVACIARLRRRWVALGLFTPFALLSPLPFAVASAFASVMSSSRITASYFWPLVALTLCYVLGLVWLCLRGFRRDAESGLPAAAAWPCGKLAVWLLVAGSLQVMTLWNMRRAARQQLAALQIEARAIALSVAPPRVPDRENAALIYEHAVATMVPDEAPTPESSIWTHMFDPDFVVAHLKDPSLRQFLERNQPALALLRQAAAKPGYYVDHDYSRPSIETMFPEIDSLRRNAKLLELDARVKNAEGDSRRAIEDVQAIYAMADHVKNDSFLVPMLIAAKTDRCATETLQAVLSSGQVAAEDLADLQLNDSVSYRKVMDRVFRMEQAAGLTVFCDLDTLTRMVPGFLSESFAMFRTLHPLFLLDEDLTSYREAFHALLTATPKPYWEAKGDLDKLDQHLKTKARGVVTRSLLPALSSAAIGAAIGDARREVAKAAVAAYRYRVEQGRFPDRLEGVVPKYLPIVPTDPFDGKPIRLKATKDGVVVHSIGPDGVDNGGAPIDWKNRTGDISFTVAAPAETSRGR